MSRSGARALLLLGLVLLAVAQDTPPATDGESVCVAADLEGEWVLELEAEPTNALPLLAATDCLKMKPSLLLEASDTLKLTLKSPNVAMDVERNTEGTWTMVYGVGFEITIDGKKYFSFLAGDKDGCHRTKAGVAHNADDTHWACFAAQKVKHADGSPVDPRPLPRGEPPIGAAAEEAEGDAGDAGIASRLAGLYGGLQRAVDEAAATAAAALGLARRPGAPEDEPAALSSLEISRNLAAAERYAAHINAEQSSWRAAASPRFAAMTRARLRRMLGSRPARRLVAAVNPLKTAFRMSPQEERERYGDLPENFDWRSVNGVDYDPPVDDQSSCGSCYAVSSAAMLTARARVQSREAARAAFSAQDVVSCSPYSDGCDGGEPFLAFKYGADVGIVDAACFPYADYGYKGATAPPCRARCPGGKTLRRKVTNYQYVGGFYGNCSEVGMMRAILEGGPIVTALNAKDDLVAYNAGVYHHVPRPPGPHLEGMEDAFFEPTNHAVVVVGWGVEAASGEKYWIIRNSWGADWGEGGYFRIRRGTDESAVEAEGVFADPVFLPGDLGPPSASSEAPA